MAASAVQKPARRGLGLGHAIVLLLLLGVVVGGVFVLSYTWAFYLGGTFHILPWWQAIGKAHAKGGDYIFYVWIAPQTRDVRAYLETNLTGNARLCTPRGEDIGLTLGGGMRKHLGTSTDGEAISLYLSRVTLTNSPEDEPNLQLKGHWRNPKLVMDDGGTIGKAFAPDGTVLRRAQTYGIHSSEVVPIVFSAGGFYEYKRACAAMRR